jgi:hypothetical protein
MKQQPHLGVLTFVMCASGVEWKSDTAPSFFPFQAKNAGGQ